MKILLLVSHILMVVGPIGGAIGLLMNNNIMGAAWACVSLIFAIALIASQRSRL
jgi:hypothetical protein